MTEGRIPAPERRTTIVALALSRVSFAEALERVLAWARARQAARVCFANVHMTIEAEQDPAFAEQVNGSALVLADGLPLALAVRWLDRSAQERVSGMDFFPASLARAEAEGLSVFFFGGSERVLAAVRAEAERRYPRLRVAGTFSPPFRSLSAEEEAEHDALLRASGAHLIYVSLGCPKQEKWMARHQGQLDGVLLGVGGAFPVFAGLQQRAPLWMQHLALEWVYRLYQEPSRLWRRYLYTNSRFVWLLSGRLLRRAIGLA